MNQSQSQQQHSRQQSGSKNPKSKTDRAKVTSTTHDTDPPVADTAANPAPPVDDGRTIRGNESDSVRPERDVEGRGHGTEDAFDVDNRGQR